MVAHYCWHIPIIDEFISFSTLANNKLMWCGYIVYSRQNIIFPPNVVIHLQYWFCYTQYKVARYFCKSHFNAIAANNCWVKFRTYICFSSNVPQHQNKLILLENMYALKSVLSWGYSQKIDMCISMAVHIRKCVHVIGWVEEAISAIPLVLSSDFCSKW